MRPYRYGKLPSCVSHRVDRDAVIGDRNVVLYGTICGHILLAGGPKGKR